MKVKQKSKLRYFDFFVMQTPRILKEVSKKLLANVWCSKRNNTKLTAPGEEETTCQFQLQIRPAPRQAIRTPTQ